MHKVCSMSTDTSQTPHHLVSSRFHEHRLRSEGGFLLASLWGEKNSWIIQQHEGSQQHMKIGYSDGQTQRSPSWCLTHKFVRLFSHASLHMFTALFSSPLQITPESENDFGSYNCTASNEMGTESKEFLLIQAGQWWGCDLNLILIYSIWPWHVIILEIQLSRVWWIFQ